MKTIEIEDSVYLGLEQRVKRFGERPNDVIKRLLADSELRIPDSSNTSAVSELTHVGKPPIFTLVESPEYRRGKAKDRYFSVLRFIQKADPQKFEKLDGFCKSTRIQISKNPTTIKQSGRHTLPEQLDGTPFWVATNLSNERKQALLNDMLQFLGYDEQTIRVVVESVTARFTPNYVV